MLQSYKICTDINRYWIIYNVATYYNRFVVFVMERTQLNNSDVFAMNASRSNSFYSKRLRDELGLEIVNETSNDH